VGAITIVMAPPGISADLPRLTAEYESSVPGLFVAGELGGLALIKNAVNQGRDCVDTIARRLAGRPRDSDVLDVCIVGAGPAGLSASRRAVEKRLTYVTLEQEELGGTVAKYPRRKLVMTSPVEWPLHGKFSKLEISKEKLMEFWGTMIRKSQLRVHVREKVEDIRREPDGSFIVTSTSGKYRARCVILALGRRGTPRKLGVPGEELPKVMYGLIEAEAYTDAAILVVGGGDSAVEAALGLAHQKGNRVTLSYRGEELSRVKERNAERLGASVRAGKVRVLYRSQVREVRERSVLVDVAGTVTELPNDWVWIFAGGEPPRAFLEKVGVASGDTDLTREAQAEARLARAG
jgi:thioredoxin reductase